LQRIACLLRMLREEFSGLFIGGSIFAFQAGQSILQFVCSEEQRRNSEQAQQPNPETYSHFTAPWRPGEFSGTQTALTIILLPTRAPELKGLDNRVSGSDLPPALGCSCVSIFLDWPPGGVPRSDVDDALL